MPKNPKMTEKDFTPGESKDEIEEILKTRVGSEIVNQFEEAKWNDKVRGYEMLADWLFADGISLDMIEHSIRFIKIKQKDWKESNMNLIKACLAF